MQKATILLLIFSFITYSLHSQYRYRGGWKTTVSSGLDLNGLLQINPRIGGGESQIGFGGAFGINANLNKSRISWDNGLSINYGIQNSIGSTNQQPVVKKSVDQIRVNSKLGYRLSLLDPGYKYLATADLTMISQLTQTYEGNLLNPPTPNIDSTLLSEFLSPATGYVSLGIEYKSTDQLSLYLSPFGLKSIIVNNNLIAQKTIPVNDPRLEISLHGNPIRQNIDLQLGAVLKMNYNDSFKSDHITINSNLILFSNYLKNPEKIDLDFTNELSFRITKGFQISLWTNIFYDYDVPVQETFNFQIVENSFINNVSVANQLLIKYNYTFGEEN